jgi:BirA family transcriptional regulator, biotin operon repressor / biotin---[acetyl-CoA-carboxylase] ligase
MERLINNRLKTKTFGRVIRFYREVESTNDVAFDLAKEGACEGTVVIADRQIKGRGRLQRKWISPPRFNLYVSIILRPSISSKEATILTLVSSVALFETVKSYGIKSQIKWPNDLLINRRKVAGVLTEMEPDGERVGFVLVGLGINLNMTRGVMNNLMGEVSDIATSIREELGYEVDRSEFAANLINLLEKWYDEFNGKGKSAIIDEWKKRWGDLNKRVRVRTDGNVNVIEGIAYDLDQNGFLLVKKDNGEIDRIIAGDVTVL